MNDAPDYKSTLNLPETAFPMKANLPVREPELLKWWEDKKIYHKLLEKNKSRPTFAFPDGPPYANASIHVGHCLNKILKDFVAKYKNMSGFQTHFIPGWDCHGLPIEHQVTKDLGPARAQKTDADIRQLCRAHAEKYVGIQRDQFKRLGIFGEWDHPYKTLDPEYESANMVELGKIADSGNLYRGEKPIYWCAACRTALAEAEVEYKDHVSPSVYVSFDVKKGIEKLGKINSKVPPAVVIWTTTPWTLPANLAISLHPDFLYSAFEAVKTAKNETEKNQKETWIIACDLKTEVEKVTGWTLTQVSEPKKGSELEGLITSHPFINGQESPILIGDHVTLDAGTGAVHTAPGHGQEDYQVCLKYNIPVYCPVDDAGKFSAQVKVPELIGMKVFDGNAKVIEILQSNSHLIHEEKLNHSYPHCWRSKTPVIFRATPQWFIAMDGRDGSKKVREAALAAIKEVKWVPTWGENRITAMVQNRPDWCISRQRMWGVPIPVLYCEDCGEAKANSATMNRAAAIVAKKGIEGWYEASVEDISGGAGCDKCSSKKFKKGKDILDVWFDSGVCYAAVQEKRKGLTMPADLYLEGSDQHRGWFQSSLLTAISARGIAPFKTILTHGFVNDGDGKKMSKSVGNVLDPHKVIAGSGAEILRLWVAFEDYSSDLTAGKESFDRVTETYRRVRNTFRYMLGNLNDFDPKKNAVAYEQLAELDRWALSRLAQFVDSSIKHYEEYEFHKIYQSLQNYFTVDLSATYLDILKDRLYTFGKDSPERRSSQTVLFEITRRTSIVMAPILSFLAEEVYQTATHKPLESVFLEDIQACPAAWKNEELEKNWQKLLELRSVVLKPLEEARQQKMVGAALEAKVTVDASGEFFTLAKKYEHFLPDLFIVSQVALTESKLSGVQVKIEKAKGDKCVRCWHYDTLTGPSDLHPSVCPKCVKALKLNEANA